MKTGTEEQQQKIFQENLQKNVALCSIRQLRAAIVQAINAVNASSEYFKLNGSYDLLKGHLDAMHSIVLFGPPKKKLFDRFRKKDPPKPEPSDCSPVHVKGAL